MHADLQLLQYYREGYHTSFAQQVKSLADSQCPTPISFRKGLKERISLVPLFNRLKLHNP